MVAPRVFLMVAAWAVVWAVVWAALVACVWVVVMAALWACQRVAVWAVSSAVSSAAQLVVCLAVPKVVLKEETWEPPKDSESELLMEVAWESGLELQSVEETVQQWDLETVQ